MARGNQYKPLCMSCLYFYCHDQSLTLESSSSGSDCTSYYYILENEKERHGSCTASLETSYWSWKLRNWVNSHLYYSQEYTNWNNLHSRLTSYKAIHKRLGLLSTRQQNHTFETIRGPVQELRKRFPKAGAREWRVFYFMKRNWLFPGEWFDNYFIYLLILIQYLVI